MTEQEETQDAQDIALICWHVWHSKRYPYEFYESVARAYKFRGGPYGQGVAKQLAEDITDAMVFLERLEGHGVQPHTGYLPSHSLAAT